jgi:hypothetical protein
VAGLLALVWTQQAPTALAKAARKGYTYLMGTTLLGICIFQAVVEGSGSADHVRASLETLGLPPTVLLFAAPFVLGLLSGATLVYVVTSIALLGEAGMITPGPQLLLAYSAGFMGVLLAPVHPCLTLTVRYFGATYGAVYRKLIVMVAVSAAAAALLAWLGWPWLS